MSLGSLRRHMPKIKGRPVGHSRRRRSVGDISQKKRATLLQLDSVNAELARVNAALERDPNSQQLKEQKKRLGLQISFLKDL